MHLHVCLLLFEVECLAIKPAARLARPMTHWCVIKGNLNAREMLH